MKVLIIEDEKPASDYLTGMLQNLDDSIVVMDIIDNVNDAIRWFQNHEADLVFLDIHLGDDSSFKIFQEVKVKTPIIVTTAYNQYAIQAFKLNSVDYLLKPFSKDDLEFAIKKFKSIQPTVPDYQALFESIQQKKYFQERFMVTFGQKIRSIPVDEVAYFVSEGRYVKLVTHANEKFLLDFSLEHVQSKVDPGIFFRVNRQALISYKSIQQMIIWSKSRVKLELKPPTETEIIVSIDKSGEFKKWLNR